MLREEGREVRVDREKFMILIRELYLQNPCQVSDLAFWKLARMLQQSDTYSERKNGNTYLYALQDQHLVFYWSEDRQRFLMTPREIAGLEFLVLHSDYYRLIADQMAGYLVRESHPLLYDFSFNHELEYSEEFLVTDYDFAQEQDHMDAAAMLNHCYDADHHTPDELVGWTELPVFDQSLWLWIRNRMSGEAAGLAISTYQAGIRETYLDWIQVLPEYQGRGLGRRLVSETIRRAKDRSDIIRVTGTADRFYQKCGFSGTESWRIASKP